MKENTQKELDAHMAEHTEKMDEVISQIKKATDLMKRERDISKGEKGDMPVAGVDFPIPENGKTPDIDAIVPLVIDKVLPHLKHGETPIKGVHYFDGEDGTPGANPEPEDVVTIIKDKKLLKPEHIDGFEQSITTLFEQFDRAPGRAYLHGGGDTVKAGSNITLTRNADGTTTITSSGGSGFTTLTATETPSAVTPVFTFTFAAATAQPSFIITDNVWQRATTKSGTVNWTWNNALKQATFTVPPQDEVLGVV